MGGALCNRRRAHAVPGEGEAQQPAKVPEDWVARRPFRVQPSSPRPTHSGAELRELGYVEGKNMTIEYRYAMDKLDRLPALADELVRLKVDVLIAAQDAEALAAKNATKTIPIVFYRRA